MFGVIESIIKIKNEWNMVDNKKIEAWERKKKKNKSRLLSRFSLKKKSKFL